MNASDNDFPDFSVLARKVAEEISDEPIDERVRLIREAMEYIVTIERNRAGPNGPRRY